MNFHSFVSQKYHPKTLLRSLGTSGKKPQRHSDIKHPTEPPVQRRLLSLTDAHPLHGEKTMTPLAVQEEEEEERPN